MRSQGLTLAAGALVASACLTAPAVAAPDAPDAPGAPGLTNTATFNSIGGTEIIEHLVYLIDGAAAGSSIKFTAFRFEEEAVTVALMRAARRGVKVQLLVDGGATTSEGTQFGPVQEVLYNDGDDATWALSCGELLGRDPSCHGTNVMHNKFALFSETRGTDNVVSTGSANLNNTSGRKVWNSWYTHVENRGLYERFAGYFADMSKKRHDFDYYNTNPPKITGNIKSYFYPRERVEGDLSANDTFVHTLDATVCPGKIRIANWSISRSPVAHALISKAAGGCSVEIVARKIHPAACEPLAAAIEAGVDVRMWSNEQGDDAAPNYVHSKDAMIEAGYPNTGEQAKVVFTGSANLNRPSLEKNDENVIRIMNQEAVYDQFVNRFRQVKLHVASTKQGFEVRSVEDCERAY